MEPMTIGKEFLEKLYEEVAPAYEGEWGDVEDPACWHGALDDWFHENPSRFTWDDWMYVADYLSHHYEGSDDVMVRKLCVWLTEHHKAVTSATYTLCDTEEMGWVPAAYESKESAERAMESMAQWDNDRPVVIDRAVARFILGHVTVRDEYDADSCHVYRF